MRQHVSNVTSMVHTWNVNQQATIRRVQLHLRLTASNHYVDRMRQGSRHQFERPVKFAYPMSAVWFYPPTHSPILYQFCLNPNF